MRALRPLSVAATLGLLAAGAGCDAGRSTDRAEAWTPAREAAAPGAVREALRDGDPYARAQRLGALLPTLGADAIPEVREVLRDPTLELGVGEQELLVRFWASHDPEKATNWAANWTPLIARPAVVLVALPYWVAADLQASLIAVDQWRQWRPDIREAALRGLVRGWYDAGQPGLTDYIRDMKGGFDRQLALSLYLRAAIQKEGVEAVTGWAEAVPEDDKAYKLSVYRQVASALALYDPAATIRWCEAHCDGPYGSNLRKIIAGHWVMQDGPAAFEWLSTAPEGPEKRHAIRVTFGDWAIADPDAALAWIEGMTSQEPIAPWLEPVYPVYARLLAQRSPLDAIAWANRIADEHEREIVLIDVATAWHQSDEAAAEAWLEASPLSEDARAKVRDPNRRRRAPDYKPTG